MFSSAPRTEQNKTLIIVGSYHIGKEKIFLHLARDLGLKVYASSDKLRTLRALNLFPSSSLAEGAGKKWSFMDVFTSDMAAATVHVVPMNVIRADLLEAYLSQPQLKNFKRVVGFRPTGWAGNKPHHKVHTHRVTIHQVPYSEHSTFKELRDFIRVMAMLNVKRIMPTVNMGKRREMIAMFSDLVPNVSEF